MEYCKKEKVPFSTDILRLWYNNFLLVPARYIMPAVFSYVAIIYRPLLFFLCRERSARLYGQFTYVAASTIIVRISLQT